MPGQYQHSVASAVRAAAEAASAGVGGVMLFGIPSSKDEAGAEASDPDGIMQRALRAVVGEVGDDIVVIGDVNLDEYTTHGHSGVLGADGDVDNDRSIARFAEVAVAQADAGAQVVAPSGMMDGQVGRMRDALDAAGHQSVAIMAYATKFRLQFLRTLPRCGRVVARRQSQDLPTISGKQPGSRTGEVLLDVDQGADIVMVKPALPYLDVITRVTDVTHLPVAAYQVSGEYIMVEAAAAQGGLDRSAAIRECLLSIRRAGAAIIVTYWATEAAGSLLAGSTIEPQLN